MEKKTYSVYVHRTPDGRYYTGVTNNIKNRWHPSQYQNNSLWPYIEQYGWDNIEHSVVFVTNCKEDALRTEDRLICFYHSIGRNINNRRSGLIRAGNKKSYCRELRRELYHNCADYRKRAIESDQRRNSTTPRKIYNRVTNHNRNHPDKAVETPLEAKRKYLENGYIPTYIKNDDL